MAVGEPCIAEGCGPDFYIGHDAISADDAVISDVTSGAAYKHADGFDEVYGDYGEVAITSEGKRIATWGEGPSWSGPGGVWFNRQN